MPVKRHAGVYWGFLWPFKRNTDVYTELVVGRDGMNWQRTPQRTRLLEFGEPGAWDSGMIFAGPSWVEVDDEWWLYYAGWDGPHGGSERTPGIGLATIRKEGFYSLRGPARGGVVATRSLLWPGGPLLVNADASSGELKARITDELRRPIEGFEYEACEPFLGDAVRHELRWNGRSLHDLAGRTIRIDFHLHDADLFAFAAGSP